MKTGSAKTIVAAASVVILGFTGVFLLSNFLEKNRIALPEAYQDSDLALQGKRLKGFALGAEGLLADWYWVQSLQYLGNKIDQSESDYINVEDLSSLNPRLLYPYLDNATDLDPKFMAAYSYGAIVLPAVDRSKAIQLTEKGIANNPEAWRLFQYLGYIHWRSKSYEKAAEVYDRGSLIAGVPPFMKMMAAAMRTEGGSRDTARAMYQQMFDEAENQQTRSNAEFRLWEIDSLEERDAIRSALKKFADANGRCPRLLKEILPLLRTIELSGGKDFRMDASNNLVDPTGAPYILDEASCEVRPGPQSKLSPQ